MDDVTLARFAELAVDFGANLQPGQVVSLSGAPGKERLVRAIATRAYEKGAKFVDLAWFDPWIKRARIAHAAHDTLEYVPPHAARKALAAARNIADGGSLTVVATAPVPFGGESTVVALDGQLTALGRFPALDLPGSGTLRADALVGEKGAEAIAKARVEAAAE